MTSDQPHPQRCCETCKNIPCKPLDRIPCSSHTSSHRIEQVIKELVDLEAKSLSTCDTAFGYREGLKTAIALLRGEQR